MVPGGKENLLIREGLMMAVRYNSDLDRGEIVAMARIYLIRPKLWSPAHKFLHNGAPNLLANLIS